MFIQDALSRVNLIIGGVHRFCHKTTNKSIQINQHRKITYFIRRVKHYLMLTLLMGEGGMGGGTGIRG